MRYRSSRGCNAAASLLLMATVSACTSLPRGPTGGFPYPQSRYISGVTWDFSQMQSQRRAHGSDLWPCTWAADDNLYCSFGDGGGFDGDSDVIGRVSLGFARITGSPSVGDPGGFAGKNVWGDFPQYAEHPATFGGKVASMISVDGKLYAYGALWTPSSVKDPVHKGSEGPVHRLIWSDDLGATWQIAPWEDPLFGSFLNFGRDAAAPDSFVYIYYKRAADETNVYLARVPKTELTADPSSSQAYQYLTGVDRRGHPRSWSKSQTDAGAVFADPAGADVAVIYDAPLRRFLLFSGHNLRQPAAGKVGLFDAPHPWGPWTTVGYYDDWGSLGPESRGDFLGVVFPVKWISHDGRTLWGIFSSMGQYDSFNIVRATLSVSHRWWRR